MTGAFAWGRDQWVNVTTNIVGSYYCRHTLRQAHARGSLNRDLNASHEMKIGDHAEHLL